MNNELRNSSGCTDKTAYEAIRNIRREERKNLIEELNAVAKQKGYIIVSKIVLKEIQENE